MARAQTQKFQSWMWCWDWPRLKPRSFDLEYVIPAIDQATKLVCNSKSSMIDSLCVKMEIPLIGIPESLPWFLHPFTMYLLLFKWLSRKACNANQMFTTCRMACFPHGMLSKLCFLLSLTVVKHLQMLP